MHPCIKTMHPLGEDTDTRGTALRCFTVIQLTTGPASPWARLSMTAAKSEHAVCQPRTARETRHTSAQTAVHTHRHARAHTITRARTHTHTHCYRRIRETSQLHLCSVPRYRLNRALGRRWQCQLGRGLDWLLAAAL